MEIPPDGSGARVHAYVQAHMPKVFVSLPPVSAEILNKLFPKKYGLSVMVSPPLNLHS